MLLVGVGRLDHAGLVEGFPRYLHPDWQTRLGEAAGHGDGGQAGDVERGGEAPALDGKGS